VYTAAVLPAAAAAAAPENSGDRPNVSWEIIDRCRQRTVTEAIPLFSPSKFAAQVYNV